MNKRSGEQSRQKILAAARQVFAEHGYAHASMRLIAQASGLSVGGVYLYFPGKDELYRTLMATWMDELNSMTLDALQGIQDPREAIGAFITITIDFAGKHREMILLQGKELGFSFGLELKQRFFRGRRTLIRQIVDNGIRQGVFSDCNSEAVAKIIFNTLRGYIISMVIDVESLFAPEECVNLILNGLIRRYDR